jgi:hypothetical protein
MKIYKLEVPLYYFVSDNPEKCLVKISEFLLKNKDKEHKSWECINLLCFFHKYQVIFEEVYPWNIDLNNINNILALTPFREDKEYIEQEAIKKFNEIIKQ